MELIINFIDFFIRLNRYLGSPLQDVGAWTCPIVFVVIFYETGLVVTPILAC